MANDTNGTGKRGFGAMDKSKQREIASKGGQASRGGNGGANRSNTSGEGGQTGGTSESE